MTREELIAFDAYICTLHPLEMKKEIDAHISAGKLTTADVVAILKIRQERERKQGKRVDDKESSSEKAK